MTTGARTELLPALDLLEVLLGEGYICPVVLEDNEATEAIARKGYSPALRHLNRTQRIAIGWIHELVAGREIPLADELRLAGEVPTKAPPACRAKAAPRTRAQGRRLHEDARAERL